MANPQVENGYTRIANELLEALGRARLTEREFRIVLAVIRLTYGFNQKQARISLQQLAELTGMDKANIHRTLKRLEAAQVLTIRKAGRRLEIAIQKDYEKWLLSPSTTKAPKAKPAKAEKPVIVPVDNNEVRCPRQQQNIVPVDNKNIVPVDNKNSRKGLEAVGEAGPIKKYKKNIKDIIKEKGADDDQKRRDFSQEAIKEIVQEWERAFGSSFPKRATKEEVLAADYMLYLLNEARLGAIKKPAAYLKKLAGQPLENFPPLQERRQKTAEAEARINKLAEKEKERALKKFEAAARAEKLAQEKWASMSQQEKRLLLEAMKIRWPGRPYKFWEKQAIVALKKEILREEVNNEKCQVA